jgi:multidrug resistance efflux pump
VPDRPYVIAAPYDGVIYRIYADPNAQVRQGELVLALEDAELRGQLQEAEERVRVAQSRVERATSASFGDQEEAGTLATLRAEQEVAASELAQLRDQARRTQITAPTGGMVLYSDRRDWEGRAVRVGEPVLQVADPDQVVVRIELPAREQIELRPGAAVRLWLDADPLWSRQARVESASYQARTSASGVLSFAMIAQVAGDPPRIGSRGTAKVYGNWAPLAYAVLRRPISALRQAIGI